MPVDNSLPAFTHIPASAQRGLFCFGDHASKDIPPHYNGLGLSKTDKQRHIAWDIGTAALCYYFAQKLGAEIYIANFSRLLIDANRACSDSSLIPTHSDGSDIRANINLTKSQRQQRIAQFYTPYHNGLTQALDDVQRRFCDPLIVSVHSFTPQLKANPSLCRTLDIGLLWKADLLSTQRFNKALYAVHPYQIELNAPYSAFDLNHSMDYHISNRNVRHLTLEIRQDLINTPKAVARMGAHLTQALKKLAPLQNNENSNTSDSFAPM